MGLLRMKNTLKVSPLTVNYTANFGAWKTTIRKKLIASTFIFEKF